MSLKGSGGGEFAKLVSDHVLGHIDRHMLPAVVHGDRVARQNPGKMVDARDQVFSTFFSPVSFISLTRFE